MTKNNFKGKNKRSRRWAFTSFLLGLFTKFNYASGGKINYLIMGLEICPKTKRKHIQGYIELKNQCVLKGAQKILGDKNAHFEKAKGNNAQNMKYCKKGGNFKESKNAHRSKTSLCNVKDYESFIKHNKSDWVILDQSPKLFLGYMNCKKMIINTLQGKKQHDYSMKWLNKFIPNKYQLIMLEHIFKQNERQITWVCDKKGGCGKTWFSKWFLILGAFRVTNSKSKDICYAYNYQDVIIFDFSRSLEEYVNYDILEQLKNGMIFSSKYKTSNKFFEPPKIIVMANFLPKLEKLSMDRWDILNI